MYKEIQKMKEDSTELPFENMHRIDPKSMTFINSPSKFYNRINELIKQSKNASIITLYFSKGMHCREIFENLLKIENAVVHVDMLESFRTRNSFFNLKITEIPRNWFNKNILGLLIYVQHCKMYIFDDVILVSGANLSVGYFTNTFDRVLEIRSSELCRDVLGLMCLYDGRLVKHLSYLRNSISYLGNSISHLGNSISKKDIKKSGDTYVKTYSELSELEILKYLCNISGNEIIYLSTGYLNLPFEYIDLLKNKNCKIFAPCLFFSRNSNRKNTDYTFMGRIYARLHTFLYGLIYEKICQLLNLYVFRKEDRKFHMKGVWLFKEGRVYTLLGSSNFNRRSSGRDSELNFLLISSDESVISNLRKEVDFIERFSTKYKMKRGGVFGWICDILVWLLDWVFGSYM